MSDRNRFLRIGRTMARTSIIGLMFVATGVSTWAPAAATTQKSVHADDSPMMSQPALPTRVDDPSIEAQVASALFLSDVSLQTVDVVTETEQALISIQLDGENRTIRLFREARRPADFRVLDDNGNGLVEVEAPSVTTFRGFVEGGGEIEVAASIRDGDVYALLLRPDGSGWGVEPVPGTHAQELGAHAVYRIEDALRPNVGCMVDGHPIPQPPTRSQNPTPTSRGSNNAAWIAFDADNDFYQLNGSSITSTVFAIEMLLHQVALIYQTQLNICYPGPGTIIVRTSALTDPYAGLNNGIVLFERFRDTWNEDDPVNRDIAHLMTSKPTFNPDDMSPVSGYASIGVACEETLAYGFSSWNQLFTTVSRVANTAHELGHNWGACHCDDSDCTGGPPDLDCGIMWSSTGTQQETLTFGSTAISAISAYQSTTNCGGSCQDVAYVDPNGDPFSCGGAELDPTQLYEEAVECIVVGGEITGKPGSYNETLLVQKPLTLTVNGSGSVIIGVSP